MSQYPPGGPHGVPVVDLPMAVIPTTQLADGEFIGFRVRVPANRTLKIRLAGVQTDGNTAPSGLTAEVDDETNSTNLVSQNSKRATGNPLAEVTGAVDVLFAAENDTGNQQNATGHFAYRVA